MPGLLQNGVRVPIAPTSKRAGRARTVVSRSAPRLEPVVDRQAQHQQRHDVLHRGAQRDGGRHHMTEAVGDQSNAMISGSCSRTEPNPHAITIRAPIAPTSKPLSTLDRPVEAFPGQGADPGAAHHRTRYRRGRRGGEPVEHRERTSRRPRATRATSASGAFAGPTPQWCPRWRPAAGRPRAHLGWRPLLRTARRSAGWR